MWGGDVYLLDSFKYFIDGEERCAVCFLYSQMSHRKLHSGPSETICSSFGSNLDPSQKQGYLSKEHNSHVCIVIKIQYLTFSLISFIM